MLYFAGMCYMFLSLHIVCDDYFVASISEIVQRFGCDEDVAARPSMAASSSAPELLGAIGVFVSGSEEVGVGTVVGSCVFQHVCHCRWCGIDLSSRERSSQTRRILLGKRFDFLRYCDSTSFACV